jgi:endoglucanase
VLKSAILRKASAVGRQFSKGGMTMQQITQKLRLALVLAVLVAGFASQQAMAQTRLRGTTIGLPIIWPLGPPVGDQIAQIHPQLAANLLALGAQGANVVRYPLIWNNAADNANESMYDQWLYYQLALLDDMIPVCRRAGLKIIINLTMPPGGHVEEIVDGTVVIRPGDIVLSENPGWTRGALLRAWLLIASRYNDRPEVLGYDILNEPMPWPLTPAQHPTPAGRTAWHSLATDIANTIRTIDGWHTIIVEAPKGDPQEFDFLEPIRVSNVEYSFHMYDPVELTGQGLSRGGGLTWPLGVEYPGVVRHVAWNQATLREWLMPVRRFQANHAGSRIFVGEFSCVRWADSYSMSAYNYLSDCMATFEAYGWDYTYHSWREATCWSLEMGSDMNNMTTFTTRRLQLFHSYFARNGK